MLALLLACSSPAECPACPACEACDEPGVALEPWEEELLGPVLDELRAGIVLHGDEPFGVCRGASGCDEFLGQDVGDLPEGDFLLRAELKAPAVGEGWTVDFRVDCTTTRKNGEPAQHDHDRSYEVKYTGAAHGYRLQPLWKIQSPHPSGARDCTYSLTPRRPDGTAGEAWTGSYKTPAPA